MRRTGSSRAGLPARAALRPAAGRLYRGTGGARPERIATSAKPAAALTVVVGHGAEEVSLDPNGTTTQGWYSVLYNLYDTLLSRDKSGKLAPGLAESWQNIDPTTWEFKLRKA